MSIKNINIYRKNEFVGNVNKLKILVNQYKYDLPSNSSINVKIDEVNIDVTVKYLWLKSNVKLNEKENNFSIRIRPLVNNISLIISISLIIISLIIRIYFPSDLSELLFKFFGLSFISLFVFITTIGSKYFYKIEVNKK